MTEGSAECWMFTDEQESCLDYHILSRAGAAGQSLSICNASER